MVDAVQAADFNDPANVTQSSQLHLESVIAAIGPAFCMLSANRAEPRGTVHHAEYQHLEAGLLFISFDDLLTRIKDIVCTVIDNTITKPATRP